MKAVGIPLGLKPLFKKTCLKFHGIELIDAKLRIPIRCFSETTSMSWHEYAACRSDGARWVRTRRVHHWPVPRHLSIVVDVSHRRAVSSPRNVEIRLPATS
jgi:hypothetical protein